MATDIKAPQFPESVADGTVATWHKQEGEAVKRDELLVDIETDKVVLEVVAPADGVVSKIMAAEGETVESQQVLGTFDEGASGSAGSSNDKPAETDTKEASADHKEDAKSESADNSADDDDSSGDQAGPAARKLMSEHGIAADQVKGTGRGGRITKGDVEKVITDKAQKRANQPAPQQPATLDVPGAPGEREERRVPMTRLRKRIAERLVSAQQDSAMLTTFNEVNMKPIMDMRKHYQPEFEKAHNVRLGFMGFFTRACVEALKRFPAVNASIDGEDIVYHGYYDVGVAVSTERGLVVPVLRDADQKGLAEVESQIIEYGQKAQKGKLSIEEMTGGTFTISNGGVFGSLISTPILNPPQTAILGMHKIQERPMAVDGKVEILPMMYLALSYDHRLIDGKEAVQFLVAVKNFIEDPARLLLDI
ncbi:dihydrolipoamide succinyltransferase [Alcanivorax sp. 97CO-5]|jgi:2-oxoglutarate dehydrogenase E2 component (dihydrolipoamide succinyltransferase)|uniref:Dihydrolipoyllysine-residue succinyltransferase component of 2-oxoglutarate dehydrogenase complex n=2 Tax=Alcanivorax TaxID=59753 RepID=Q0VPF5_ALCBS|nr:MULTISPECIES: 2-oxoglutarate dehydrogenase complex dihydrolipoyllysine-residue succinyltransferase [Alcanivorax]EUC70445.1 dihydrolipoamide succinyltransferase [Alcanivorax sp. 97CO-5]PKG02107.1 dihydrolipoyllysine-residue succinyltransferase [Alcanivorax sp. 97CO-6]BAP14397.1 dihydrolipoamide succinyltransferase [Alcanivorax sp. NBRC 101098]CAL16943.1 dihydrolipoamide succinyltransferase [Alcanivorax borkumensis SK2]